eukprot:TRINITY_DN1239_c0_g1_i1.p1 TRINITY_DN1239_c0_g1~~TRINITY_DN1239_c0_g1_i1.p1  ORF type:complete len:179 (-),score=56.74 TRINITY_DN1239_c0_g1_i1:95-631(-)
MGRAGQTKCTKKVFGKTKRTVKKSAAKAKPAKLKKNITPGSVLILLAGRFRGRRVVFLKQLDSGLLLVTGPYAVNGVPLRRVNQRYCIATSAKVDMKGADYAKVTDAHFARDAKKKAKKGESGFFAESKEAKPLPEEKKAEQKKLDAALVKNVSGDLKAYLKSRFSLSSGMYPHEMKF